VLNQLNFQNNQLMGTIPTELGSLSGLIFLGFNNNHFTGTVPTELGALTGLSALIFDRNKLAGTVPDLPFKQYTTHCCLSPNNFSCPLPADATACICYGNPGVVCN
jgi:hypothetical protein